jgi:thiamine pyrophosphate-dependent acetolactate synthase large subunit-like protein
MTEQHPERASGGAAVIDSLVAHGVTNIFGIPGTHNLELYRYLPESGIRHTVTRHEQGAGYAADGYARVSGRPGVIITTSGPGITNAITALATAYADSVPVLAISPGPPRGTVNADIGWLHEVKDQQGALGSVCGRSIRVESPDEIPAMIAETFVEFASTRPRPVHLEVPVDVLEGPWTRRPVVARPLPAPVGPPPTKIEEIARALDGSQRPLLVVGGGARAAAHQVRGLADLGVRVLTTVNGKGILDESHPAALGANIRLPAAHALINDADVLIVVGSELGDSDLWGGVVAPGGPGRTIVRVDLDAAQQHKNVAANLPVIGDATVVLTGLLDLLHAKGFAARAVDPADRASVDTGAAADGGPWAEIQRVLHAALPPDTIVAGDSSQVTYYGTVHHWPFTPGNRLLYPTGYATLGYGLPAAIGAKVSAPERPVVAVFGDGAAMFSIQELITATEQRLALPVVIVDNGGYAEIREQMVERGIEPQAVDLYRPDIPALARAIGANGVVADDIHDIGRLTAEALHAERPTVIYHHVG